MSNGMQYGGFWRRVIAVFVDAFVFGFIALPLFFAVVMGIIFYVISMGGAASTTIGGNEIIAGFVINLVILLVYIGYFAGMESSSRQATYGKMMLGVKVVDEDGFRISFWHAVGRYFAKYLSVFTLFIGFLMAAFTKKKQALHDMVAKTLVIKEGGCTLWPAIKAVLISLLIFVLLVAGCVYYGYVKYGSMLDEKSIQEFFIELMSTATLTGHIDTTDPLSKTTDHLERQAEEGNKQKELTSTNGASNFVPTDTPLVQKVDGLLYKIDEDLPYTGVNHTYYENGQKKEESNVVEGRSEGPYTTWHENGKKKTQGNLEQGLPHGPYTAWHENGNKEQELNFVKNIYEGVYVLYFKNGQPSQTGTYEKGNLHGQIIFWDEEGNFTESRIYENGELLETSTTPSENLAEVANSLTTDSQDHEAPATTEETFDLENNNDAASPNAQLKESFHENGVKKMEAHYVDGKLNGSSTLWNEYGQKIIIVNYKEDKRHGLLTRWHSNGQKKIEINYTDDKRDGEMTFWHENGDVKKTLTYSNGELVENVPDKSPTTNNPAPSDTNLTYTDPPDFKSKGITTTVGPMVLEIRRFMQDEVRMYTHIAFNEQNELAMVDITIDSVLDKNNTNFYDAGDDFESEFFRKKQFRDKIGFKRDHLKAERSVNLKSGFEKEDFASMKGVAILYTPKNIETLTFTDKEINQEKTAVGNAVTITGIELENNDYSDWYSINFHFGAPKVKNPNYLGARAYNANGEELKWVGDGQTSWNVNAEKGAPTKIEIYVCEEFTVTKFPFTFTK